MKSRSFEDRNELCQKAREAQHGLDLTQSWRPCLAYESLGPDSTSEHHRDGQSELARSPCSLSNSKLMGSRSAFWALTAPADGL